MSCPRYAPARVLFCEVTWRAIDRTWIFTLDPDGGSIRSLAASKSVRRRRCLARRRRRSLAVSSNSIFWWSICVALKSDLVWPLNTVPRSGLNTLAFSFGFEHSLVASFFNPGLDMHRVAGAVFCVLTVSLWSGICAFVPLPEENMNVVSVVYVIRLPSQWSPSFGSRLEWYPLFCQGLGSTINKLAEPLGIVRYKIIGNKPCRWLCRSVKMTRK